MRSKWGQLKQGRRLRQLRQPLKEEDLKNKDGLKMKQPQKYLFGSKSNFRLQHVHFAHLKTTSRRYKPPCISSFIYMWSLCEGSNNLSMKHTMWLKKCVVKIHWRGCYQLFDMPMRDQSQSLIFRSQHFTLYTLIQFSHFTQIQFYTRFSLMFCPGRKLIIWAVGAEIVSGQPNKKFEIRKFCVLVFSLETSNFPPKSI